MRPVPHENAPRAYSPQSSAVSLNNDNAAGRYFKRRLPELDLLRAAAIILVMLFHFAGSYSLPKNSYAVRFFFWGKHGVDLFFVLSGFLIGGQIIEEGLRSQFSFTTFYIKRFWRIFPPYYFAILVFFLVYLYASRGGVFQNSAILNDIYAHLLYLQNYSSPVMYGGVYWSLAVEEQFYILIPALLYLLIRYARKGLALGLFSVIVSALVITFFLYDDSNEWWYFFMDHNIRGLSCLLSGVITAFVFLTWRERLERASGVLKITLVLITIAALGASYAYDAGLEMSWRGSLWEFIPTSVGFSSMMLFVSINPFSFPFRRVIGGIAKLSYTMYLYHVLAAILLRYIVASWFPINPGSVLNFLTAFLIYFIFVSALAGVIYWLVDRPCMDLRKRIISRRA